MLQFIYCLISNYFFVDVHNKLLIIFGFLIQAAKRAGWLPADDNMYPKTSHVGFGLVLGADGKRFRTRASEVVRLVDLLDEAKTRSQAALIERGIITAMIYGLYILLLTFLKSLYLPSVVQVCMMWLTVIIVRLFPCSLSTLRV